MYKVGFIYTRCFLQKEIEFSDSIRVKPLAATGFAGEIHDSKKLLEAQRFSFTGKNLKTTLQNFSKTGKSVVVEFDQVEAKDFIQAIESKEEEAENIMGAVAVVSANPGVPLCAYAKSNGNSGTKFFIPPDRIVSHGTNIPGYLDSINDIEKLAQTDPKISLLLKLFRASLREKEIDNQILFQLILLEEASDGEDGSFAQRLRSYAEKIGFDGDLGIIATECGVILPEGKDVIDLLIKLRNSAAHNGVINESSLIEYKAKWAVPIVQNKESLHKLMCEALRYMFCCLVGHTRDKMAIKVSGPLEITFE